LKKVKILKLKPNSRFHFGKPLLDSDTSLTSTDTYLHSDVLFSALVNNLASVKSKEDVDSFIKAFNDGEIKISSGFYCLEKEGGDYTFLLPKPANAVNQVNIDDYDRIKQVKMVQFIDELLLSTPVADWNVDKNIALSNVELRKLGLSLTKDNTIVKIVNKEEYPFKLFTKGLNTQVGLRSVKELDQEGGEKILVSKGPYQVEYIQISDLAYADLKVHFYFLYEILDNSLIDDFELAVALLAYNGIGGERSSGYGIIESIIEPKNIPSFIQEESRGSFYLSLSKVIPENALELNALKAYSHSVRGGRNTHDLGVLNSVRMINEGAVLTSSIKGKIVDLTPNNTKEYLRYGKAFLINLPNDFKND
jgi:CRISPR-associated protein Csm4